MGKIDSLKDVIEAKVAIMVEIVMHILGCSGPMSRFSTETVSSFV